MTSLGSMPLLNDYSLCRQAVTVYRYAGGAVTRTVHPRAYLESKKIESIDRTGSSEANSFLLVIPGGTQAVEVGDKVYDGDGPQVPGATTTTGAQAPVDLAAWWRAFIPSKVDGLHVVKYVDVRRWDGAVCHTEAGG